MSNVIPCDICNADSAQAVTRVRMVGSSMAPTIEHDDVVKFDAAEPRQGEVVLVRTHDGRHLIRKLTSHSDGVYQLGSINPDFETIYLAEHEVECIHSGESVSRMILNRP